MVDRPTTPRQALERLLEGHRRFHEDRLEHGSGTDWRRRLEVARGQAPFAALIACADARVPPPLLFDVGLGDLFVCRNAGNQVDSLTVGSIEFAVVEAGCPLVAVKGHSCCGALTATVDAVREPARIASPSLADVVQRLLPAALTTRPADGDRDAWVEAAARENVRRTCWELLDRSRLLADRVEAGTIGLVGLWYDLRTCSLEIIVPLDEHVT